MEFVQELSILDTYPLRHFRWPNGFQAMLVRNPVAPVLAYLTHYTVGSATETPQQRGLAHFFEHMMFRETATLRDGDFDRIVAEMGGVGLNAFTSYDTTAYHVNVPSPALEAVMRLEADRMVNLRLSPELIERERGAVLGEMHMYEDMPSEQHWNAIMAHAFPAHPYRHPIIGYSEQVAAFADADFRAFYRHHYAPNRALVVIAGDFDEAGTLALLERYYGDLPAGEGPPPPVPPDAPPQAAQRVELAHEKVSSDSLSIAARTPGLTHADMPALNLLSALLTAGQSSPLYRAIVLEGLGTAVSTTVMDSDFMLASPGLFLIDVSVQHGVRAEEAEETVHAELARLRREGIAQDDVTRAVNQLRLGLYVSVRTNMALARQVGGFALACGDPRYPERMLAQLSALTADDLQDVLQRYLLEPPMLTVIQRPARAGAA
ncbi:MAG: insulinase family protein [Candidatus Lambdaproteobacteria bacterium]|nr:insulinase family protein [Candidatus Lambdaproteobacteria bacterium]